MLLLHATAATCDMVLFCFCNNNNNNRKELKSSPLPAFVHSIHFFGCTNRNREFCSFAFDRDLLICCPATVIIAVVLASSAASSAFSSLSLYQLLCGKYDILSYHHC